MNSGPALYALADGRTFPVGSPLVRWERELLAEHIEQLAKADGREERAAQLDDISRSCGSAYAEKLKRAYAEVHQQRLGARYGV